MIHFSSSIVLLPLLARGVNIHLLATCLPLRTLSHLLSTTIGKVSWLPIDKASIAIGCVGGVGCITPHWGVSPLNLARSLNMVLVLLLLLLCCLLLKLSAVHHIRLSLKSLLVVLALSEMRSTATAKLLVLELPLLRCHASCSQ
jgi:hypothetical protein